MENVGILVRDTPFAVLQSMQLNQFLCISGCIHQRYCCCLFGVCDKGIFSYRFPVMMLASNEKVSEHFFKTNFKNYEKGPVFHEVSNCASACSTIQTW